MSRTHGDRKDAEEAGATGQLRLMGHGMYDLHSSQPDHLPVYRVRLVERDRHEDQDVEAE